MPKIVLFSSKYLVLDWANYGLLNEKYVEVTEEEYKQLKAWDLVIAKKEEFLEELQNRGPEVVEVGKIDSRLIPSETSTR